MLFAGLFVFRSFTAVCVCVCDFCRASRELDGHEGDPAGGHGVSPQIPGGDDGGAAQRRGALCGGRQKDSSHGKTPQTHTHTAWISLNTQISSVCK